MKLRERFSPTDDCSPPNSMWKEGKMEMFYLTMHSTHFIYGYKEGKKERLQLTTHSTHFIYGYMVSDIMVKDHSNSERRNLLLPLH